MRKFLPAAAILALAVPLMAAPHHDHEPSEFMRNANQDNLVEIELGHYAAHHAISHEVRDLGSEIADDHSKANDALQHVAEHIGVHLRDHLNDDSRHEVDRLEHLHGEAFDHAFVHKMIEDHQKDIDAYEHARKNAEHREVRHYAADQLPTLHHHLDSARATEAHMGMHHH